MNRSKAQIEKLEQALARAHQVQEAPPFPTAWVYSVMRDIRLHAGSTRAAIEIPRLVWRAATVVAFVSMVFVGSVLTWNAERPDTIFTGFFSEANMDPTLL
ncbi:MAG TPA: hypothetical protein VGJ57_06945 [Nitrospirales bacterium]